MRRKILLPVVLLLALGCHKPIPGLESPETTTRTFIDRAHLYLGGDMSGPSVWECFTREEEKWFGQNWEQLFQESGAQHFADRTYYTYSQGEKAALALRHLLESNTPSAMGRPKIEVVSQEEATAVVRVTEEYESEGWGYDNDYGYDQGREPGHRYRMTKQGPNWKISGLFSQRRR